MATLTFSILFSLLALLSSLSTADENNLLLTGDILPNNAQLSTPTATFVMQDDCNLVLYNKVNGFQSNTHGYGTNCSLTLTNRGQLAILSSDGSTVWASDNPPSSKPGRFAAVLRPDGQVAIYGAEVWATPVAHSSSADLTAELANIPMVRNILFSDQVLYNDAKLVSRDYSFVMRADCNLALTKASVGDTWQSGTAGKGQHCFARLDHRGQVSVEDDRYKTLWSSKAVGKEGDYVLVMQITGQAVVYGPVLWTTVNS